MKFLIIGDLHGKKPKIHFKDFDAIIAPGDFCSDDASKYRLKVVKLNYKLKWFDLVGKKKALKMIKKSLSDGREVLKYLGSLKIPIYIVPGNWDWTKARNKYLYWDLKKDFYKSLIRKIPNIIDAHYKSIDIGNYQLIGYGDSWGPEYPQSKKELERHTSQLENLKKEYKNIYKKVSSLFEKAIKPVIFLTHNVPLNTSLDKITNKKSPRYGQHYGSLIAREMIEKYQPLVCIGGHIHEHFGKCKIGKTVCINAGFGPYVNVLMELENNKIVKLQFHKRK